MRKEEILILERGDLNPAYKDTDIRKITTTGLFKREFNDSIRGESAIIFRDTDGSIKIIKDRLNLLKTQPIKGKILKCKYWVLRTTEDETKLKSIIGGWSDMGYKFPYTVGKEKGFTFQDKGNRVMPPYFSEKENLTYIYELQEI